MKVKVQCETGETTGDRGGVNVMNVDEDIVDGGYNGEVLSDGVIVEEGVRGEVDEDDGVMNEGDQCSLTRVTRMVLTDSGVVW